VRWGLVVAAFAIVAFVTALVSRPVAAVVSGDASELAAAVEAIAGGDLTVKLPGGTSELGRIGTSVNNLTGQMSVVLSHVEAGKLEVAKRWREVNVVAEQMLETSENTAMQASFSAATASHISDTMQRIAAATEEMAATIREVAAHAAQAASVAENVAQEVVAANSTVSDLEDSSIEIQTVVDLIRKIADQTHLLALNATIEAGRAGDAGHGFAVVASEVKALARQTAAATGHVNDSVKSIQTGSAQAAGIMNHFTDTMARVSDNQSAIAAAVEEQTETTKEIGRNTAMAAAGSSELAENVESLVDAIRATEYAGTHARTIAGDLELLEESLSTVLGRYTFDRVEFDATDEAPDATPAVTVDGVMTVPNNVIGTGLNQFSYDEHWRHAAGTAEESGSFCSIPGDMATLRFTGTQIRFFGVCKPNHGIIGVTLDGGPEKEIDQYAEDEESQMLWESPVLPAGEHTLKLRVTGTKSVKSRYTWVTVEHVEIVL
jgi:methyl-accepting chemotaxis protein